MSKAIKGTFKVPKPLPYSNLYIYNISILKVRLKAVAKAFSIKRH